MSLGIMGIGAGFINAACAKAKKAADNYISIISTIADPVVGSLTCVGEITVESIKNGVSVTETYSDLYAAQLSIQADVNTEIKILGNVTEFICGEYQGWGYADTILAKSLEFNNSVLTQVIVSGKGDYSATSTIESMVFNNTTALTSLRCEYCTELSALDLSACTALTDLNCNNCTGLTALDLSACTALTILSCNNCAGLTALDLSACTALTRLGCYNCTGLTALDLSACTALTSLQCSQCNGLTALDLSANTALTSLQCSQCNGLTALDLSANTALTELDCSYCHELVSISYPATNEDVSTAVARAITDAGADNGTVYTDSAADYYSTIADVATAKGWTIEQIPA